jgi:hypothetical protein
MRALPDLKSGQAAKITIRLKEITVTKATFKCQLSVKVVEPKQKQKNQPKPTQPWLPAS